MKKLGYLLPWVCVAIGASACGDDLPGVGGTETDGDEEDTGTPQTSGMSATTPTTGLTTDMTTTETTPTTQASEDSSSSGGPECTPEDECREAADCPTPGADCVACFCVGGTAGDCPMWGEGMWGDCIVPGQPAPDLEACGDVEGAGCVADNPPDPNAGICYFSGCETPCDCPQPQAGFEEIVACEDIIGDDGVNDCYFDCSGGEDCPDDMFCFQDALCMFGTVAGVDPYGDCVNTTQMCLEGICFPGDGWGWCSNIECADASECPDAPDGDAVPACDELLQDGMGNPVTACYLDCSGGQTCPTGMVCDPSINEGICIWELVEPGFGDCVNLPEAEGCIDEETCQLDDTQDPVQAVCAATDCTDPMTDCPNAPETGDAARACVDVDAAGGAECVLDCSGGETCPDGMTCGAANFCVWLDAGPCFTAIVDPSFEGGSPSDAWDEASTQFGTPLCTAGGCMGGESHTGDWFIWFGGTDEGLEVGSMEQDITIPAEALSLSFWLQFGVVTTMNPEMDNVEVLIDGEQIFVATGEDADTYPDYTQVILDVTAYADGAVHTLRLQSSIEGDELTNIFVDDVTLLCN